MDKTYLSDLEKHELENAIEAMKLGFAVRDFQAKTGLPFKIPFDEGESGQASFLAGLNNDLMAWLEIRSSNLGVGFGE